MVKITVRLREVVTYDVEVEAAGPDEAKELATEMWAQSQDPTNDFCGSGEGVEVHYWDYVDLPSTADLCKVYDAWLAERPHLRKMSADELMAEDVTEEERAWLADFCQVWEDAQAKEDEAALRLAHSKSAVAISK